MFDQQRSLAPSAENRKPFLFIFSKTFLFFGFGTKLFWFLVFEKIIKDFWFKQGKDDASEAAGERERELEEMVEAAFAVPP